MLDIRNVSKKYGNQFVAIDEERNHEAERGNCSKNIAVEQYATFVSMIYEYTCWSAYDHGGNTKRDNSKRYKRG